MCKALKIWQQSIVNLTAFYDTMSEAAEKQYFAAVKPK